ncbi:Uncharacterized conserved protein YbjT, contains NAD(P)-binding and DUF2867 domains [Streptoalloteichus tenebrarius]|uniref:Uncharacterized conserved protein YbjT, contains NAD(P)-binding and DUF2867 domains n=1 Tax=Streptoalloteichus tenebrarius (strain ATCC 17920 / DSM 40477 / JCM 4838 / CBS 697.72 / NBRC 16177 / NCIMB 11028 / NRRL B-12390 / A12253. 1 / ISP 5477) TaxID=1933 RepID=A0ABT1HS48_STRSD|nr:NmrA family NAD(P)-binding protein [Streptoalloteichus tenebrarius]MCP2258344.1 Uncharacterized conserved protein YbjT, contains NAD(P)-binding and DUF2867 domains [Streptoalloteichus tenebrarius]BFF03510.1 NAD(P)H-binding protein [Streptoalloteichus tenebrarius]
MTILVTGATGSVGRHVVNQLLAEGQRVRALTRDPAAAGLPSGVEVARGDLRSPGTVSDALAGVDRMYLFPVPETAREVVELAVGAGVRRIVVLSSSSTVDRRRTNWSAGEGHLAVERAVEDAGVEWTFVRPAGFAGNVLEWAPSIRAEGVVRAPHAAARQALIHEADIAEVATTALLRDGHAGGRYLLTGSEAISRVEQARAIGEAIGRPVRFEEITPERYRELVGPYLGDEIVDMLLGYWGDAVHTPDRVTPTVEEVLGRPPRDFAQWARDHVADFS